jgi:hypothetical protein
VGTTLRKITEVVHRITAPGATLNAMHEVDRATSTMVELEAQLRRVRPTSTPQAA